MRILLILIFAALPAFSFSQVKPSEKEDTLKINTLIEQYSQARETRDTTLLKEILTEDVDQLVSNGEWRIGFREAVDGMLMSSTANPGIRKLHIEKIKYLSDEIALVDCRYVLTSPSGDERNLWSSFTVIFHKGHWKISAIRNMDPN